MGVLDLFKLKESKNISDLDSPFVANIHREIIDRKPFLKRIYVDFYNEFKNIIEGIPSGKIIEIGSGSGFIKEIIPEIITSDVFEAKNVDMVFSATNMPFEDNSVSAFFLQNVLHHIKEPRIFFKEIDRCLVSGGKLLMIEPFNSIWGSFVYKNFHHEPFNPQSGWEISGEGRLSDANGALPWIVFFRDREIFENEFPRLKIKKLNPQMPFRYLLSGGLSLKQLVPSFSYDAIKLLENTISPLNKYLGMFITIEIEKS